MQWLLVTENNEDTTCSHVYKTMFNTVVGNAYSSNAWELNSPPLSLFFLLQPLFCLSSPTFHVSMPLCPSGAALCMCGWVWEMRGGFLVIIEANSSGHLPYMRLLARLWPGLTDHSVEGHSSTCAPGQEPETIASSCSHRTVGFSFSSNFFFLALPPFYRRIEHGWMFA